MSFLYPRPAQQGTEFWLAYPGNLVTAPAELAILADSMANFTVEIPGIGFTTSGTARPGAPARVPVPAEAAIQSSEVIESKGIHLVADSPVTAMFRSPEPPNSTDDAYLGLPVDALGRSFYVVLGYREGISAPGFSGTLAPSQFTLVATEDRTKVQVATHSAGLGGTPASTRIDLVLNRGQTWQYRCGNEGGLTGSIVIADKPVSLLGGNRCADMPPGVSVCDYLAEQVLPLELWGRDYFVIPIQNGTANLVRVLVRHDNTVVMLNDGKAVEAVKLDATGFFDLFTDRPLRVTGLKPILVGQYGAGASQPPDAIRDPFFMQDIANQFHLREHRFYVPPGYDTDFINVVAPTGARVLLDGDPVSGFQPLPGFTHQWASVQVGDGEHTVTAAEPVMVYVYGFRASGAYGYPAGLARAPGPKTILFDLRRAAGL